MPGSASVGRNLEHGLVLVGVERQALRGDAGDAVQAEHLVELALGRLDAGEEVLQLLVVAQLGREVVDRARRGCRPPRGCRGRSRSRRRRARPGRPSPSGGARSALRRGHRACPAAPSRGRRAARRARRRANGLAVLALVEELLGHALQAPSRPLRSATLSFPGVSFPVIIFPIFSQSVCPASGR